MDIENKYYFIVFQSVINHERQPISNVVIRGTHPLIWASREYGFNFSILTYVIFWEEIPEEIALTVEKRNGIHCEF